MFFNVFHVFFHAKGMARHGTFKLTQDGVPLVKELGPGDSFGELALLYSVPCSTTITASQGGELWKMERQRFLQCKASLSSSQMEKAPM